MRSLFTGSIVRSLKDRFYRIASRDAARRGGETIRCNVPALYLDSALGPLFLALSSYSLLLLLLLSLSLFSFFSLSFFGIRRTDHARGRCSSLSPINPGVVLHRSPSFMRSRAPFCPSPARPLPLVILPRLVLFSSLSSSLFLSLKLSLVPSLPPPFFHSLFLSRGMMDLRGERRRTENNKVGHAIQARMQRNYTPIFLSLEQSRTSV